MIVVVLAAPLLAWAVSPDPVPRNNGLSYAGDLENLVVKRCVSCHSSDEPKAKLVLEAGSGYGQLVGRPSVQVPEEMLVVPGDPDASYLWHKVDFTAEVGKGMPRTLFGAKRLPDDEVELFRRWIEEGALP